VPDAQAEAVDPAPAAQVADDDQERAADHEHDDSGMQEQHEIGELPVR
jgi:hypothetical protein